MLNLKQKSEFPATFLSLLLVSKYAFRFRPSLESTHTTPGRYLQTFNTDADPVFINLCDGLSYWTLGAASASIYDLVFLTHVTEDGRVYYENLQTKAVTWSLEADDRLISTSAVDSVDKVLESSRSDCEQIIGSSFPVEESMAQMIALQEYCDEHDAGVAHEDDVQVQEVINSENEKPIFAKSPFPVALDQFTDDEDDEDDDRDSKNWKASPLAANKTYQDNQTPKSRPSSGTLASVARSNSTESLPKVATVKNNPNDIPVIISRDNKQKWIANTIHVSLRRYFLLICIFQSINLLLSVHRKDI